MNQLLKAIHAGDAETVRALLEQDPGLARARDVAGASAVQLAAYHDQSEILELLLASGVELDVFEAAIVGDRELVAKRLEAAPEALHGFSRDGFPLLGFAAFFGHAELLRELLERGADPDVAAENAMRVAPLNSAAAYRDADRAVAMARLLLESGAEPGIAQAGGWTPLHQAAAAGNKGLVRLLLEHDADKSATSDDGKTPRDMALARGHEELAPLLEPDS